MSFSCFLWTDHGLLKLCIIVVFIVISLFLFLLVFFLMYFDTILFTYNSESGMPSV